MTYKASFDKTTKVITSLTSLLFLGIAVLQIVLYMQHHAVVFLASALLLLLIYFVTYWYCPINYRVTTDDVVVHRHGSDIRFLRSDIRCIQMVQKEKLKGTVRLIGVGGLFGYCGQFSNAEFGCMTWYATKHRDKMVLIELNNNKKIIVTPDEPEQFVEQFGRL